MRIHVGLVGGNLRGWSSLLQQEGISHSIPLGNLSPDRFSVIVAGNTSEERIICSIKDYLAGGGAVLCSGSMFEHLSHSACTKTSIRYLLDKPGSLFSGIGLIDCYTQCRLHPDANALNNESGAPTAFVGEFGGGATVVLPFDAGELVFDRRTSTKSFYAHHGRLPFEHVSLVSKGGVLKLVSRSLELLHHRRNLPYAHAWYFPSGDKTMFSFRVDTDYASQREIEQLYEVTRQHGVPAMWFVDVKSQEGCLDLFRHMNGDEIGIHCYDHATYEDYPRNLRNIRRALDVFSSNQMHASSFAAPYGVWNEQVGRAISECGFEFSSEFSYDYDNLPSVPVCGQQSLATLQLPIHPVSIGSLRRQGFNEQEMKTYFKSLIERKMHDHEPIILYHHPKDGHTSVLHTIFDFIKGHAITTMKMADYGRWWKTRAEVEFQLDVDGSSVQVDAKSLHESVWLHGTRGDGSEAFAPMQSKINFEEHDWKTRPEPLPLPDDIRRIRNFNPWIPLIRIEDFLRRIFMPKSK